jgi:putative ABC transport system permease protein
MRKTLSVIWHSFKMAIQELKINKFRTFLSLFGITIGIFCIIGVLSSVNSLDENIQKDLKTIGNNTIFISKWQWGSSGDYPWWKFLNRPPASMEDMLWLKQHSEKSRYICYATSENSRIEYQQNILTPVGYYSVTEDFINIQDVTIGTGRYISRIEFTNGAPVCLLGYENAVSLFGTPERALMQPIQVKGQKATIVGVFKPYGRNILQGWDYDHCVVTPYEFYRKHQNLRRTEPFIMAQPKPGVSTQEYLSDLRGALRSIRKLSPGEPDNFSLNDINVFANQLKDIFVYIQLGGAVIALFSLIVGSFGIANIMFVTVKERTPLIGLKKAIGANQFTIQAEFLLESAFLCILGGVIGLLLLWGATSILSKAFQFRVFISAGQVALAILLCTILGIISGFIPARQAARMDPVVAIRSK